MRKRVRAWFTIWLGVEERGVYTRKTNDTHNAIDWNLHNFDLSMCSEFFLLLWSGSCPHINGALTHWGRATHILTTIGSDNGLSPGRRQAIIRTNAGIFLIGPLGTNFNEILVEIRIFSFKKVGFKVSSANWRPFCLKVLIPVRSLYKPLYYEKPCVPKHLTHWPRNVSSLVIVVQRCRGLLSTGRRLLHKQTFSTVPLGWCHGSVKASRLTGY